MSSVEPAVRRICEQRSKCACERCGIPLFTVPYSLHHRRARAMGGTKRADANRPANLLVLCGSGVTGCHGWVESHRDEARELGLLLWQSQSPELVPVALSVARGEVFLRDDGSWQLAT